MICIYHNKDLDGYCSGAIVKRKFPDAIMLGWNYGQPLKDEIDPFKTIIIDDNAPNN